MIADPHEFKNFVAMKIRVAAIFGAVAVTSFLLLVAPELLATLMASLHKLSPAALVVLRWLGLAMPVATALLLSLRQGGQEREDAVRRERR